MHYTEQLLIHELAKKHHLNKEMVLKLLKESKVNSYQNVKDSKRISEIESLIWFYIKKDLEDEQHEI